jgi:RNA polymerase sigma-70 factor, ECF subfamily
VSTTIDAELPAGVIASAVGGDEAAFARIVSAHHDDMARVAYLVSGDVDLAQEATQSAWTVAWRKLGTLRDPARLRPWLVSVAVNEARQLMRRTRRRSVHELALDLTDEASAAALGASDRDGPDSLLDLLAALQRLHPSDRAIVAMRYGLGMTSAEIGVAARLSAAGVRSRLTRSLARLRKELDGG